jgi:hypothetical protein
LASVPDLAFCANAMAINYMSNEGEMG